MDQELKFEVNLPAVNTASYFDAEDRIEISLPGFDLSGAFNSQEQRKPTLVEIKGSLDDTPATPTAVAPDDTRACLQNRTAAL